MTVSSSVRAGARMGEVARAEGARRRGQANLFLGSVHARRAASEPEALPVAALARGATPPIRALRGREGSRG